MSGDGLHIHTTIAGDITVPLTTLINRVCDGAGVIYSPVRRIADAWAESRAQRMEAKTKHAVAELAQEERYRKERRATIHQNNMAAILSEAVPRITNPKADEISEDWILNFSDKCRLISDDVMQHAWARLLAGEANKPGSFSKRTVNLLSDMERSDAEKFQLLCRFVCHFDSDPFVLIFDQNSELLKNAGLSYDVLMHLESFGLIRIDTVLSGNSIVSEEWPVILRYGDRSATLSPTPGHKVVYSGTVVLTRSGAELSALVDSPEPIQGFFDHVVGQFKSNHCVIEELKTIP